MWNKVTTGHNYLLENNNLPKDQPRLVFFFAVRKYKILADNRIFSRCLFIEYYANIYIGNNVKGR